MNVNDLSPEQMERAKACKTAEELVALAQSEGLELSDEQLEAISGGEDEWYSLCDDNEGNCPKYRYRI